METLSGHQARPFDTPVGKEPLIIVEVILLSCWLSFQGHLKSHSFRRYFWWCKINVYDIISTYLKNNVYIYITIWFVEWLLETLKPVTQKENLTNPPIQFSSWYIDPMMKLFGRNSSGKTLPQSIIESPLFTTLFIFGPMRVYVAGSPSVYSHTKITDRAKLHQVSMLFAGHF